MKTQLILVILGLMVSTSASAIPLSDAASQVHQLFSGKMIQVSGTSTKYCEDGTWGCVDLRHGSILTPDGKSIKIDDSNSAVQIANTVCDFAKEWKSTGNLITCFAL